MAVHMRNNENEIVETIVDENETVESTEETTKRGPFDVLRTLPFMRGQDKFFSQLNDYDEEDIKYDEDVAMAV